jgi:hypothetical protein
MTRMLEELTSAVDDLPRWQRCVHVFAGAGWITFHVLAWIDWIAASLTLWR